MTATPVEAAPQLEPSAATETALAANAEARSQLRRQADRRELRMAFHDLAEGLRGMIRVSPLAAVFTGLALGVLISRRRR